MSQDYSIEVVPRNFQVHTVWTGDQRPRYQTLLYILNQMKTPELQVSTATLWENRLC